MNDITSWLFAIGLILGAISLIAFIFTGLGSLFRNDPAARPPRPRRDR